MTAVIACGDALVVRRPGDVVIEERTHTAPTGSMALVRPSYVGVCGTDLDIVNGDLDAAYVRYPVVLGHEWSGTVMAIGSDVEDLAEGDRVVVEGILACSRCVRCRAGQTNMCTNYNELGFTTDGAAGPAVAAPAALIHKLGPRVALDGAALVEPAAVVLHGLRELGLVPGMRTLVIGDGTVALLAAQLLRMWSPSTVVVAGRRSAQATLATAAGADSFTTDVPSSRAFDVVVEAAGSTVAVEAALGAVDRGGKVLLLGITGRGSAARLYVDDVVNNDLTIRGSFSYTASAWAETVRLLNAGHFRPDALITHRYRLEEHATAMQTLASTDGDTPRGKVLLDLQKPT